jgi:formylglycine-generating enzyme required for sulfatase activity
VQNYLTWLNQKTGKNYRLLTEAEWEYAARAGTKTLFPSGNCISTDQANYNGTIDNINVYCPQTGINRKKTLEVGNFATNAWGLHDMHGNVFEIIQDCYYESYRETPTNGEAWEDEDVCKSRRMMRSGSWKEPIDNIRSSNRSAYAPTIRSNFIGFRVAQTL